MKITPQIYKKASVKPIWCPGCGDYAVMTAMQRAFAGLKLKPEEIAVVSGIGCSGRISHYLNTYSFHGRAVPTATGIKAARPDLTVLAVGGDGDGLSIGGGHIVHAARRNPDMTYLLLDNNIYGLTKGQTSPTTPREYQSKTAPYGGYEDPMDPLPVFVTYGISFIARANSFDIAELTELITAAVKHRGMSVVYIHSPCVTHRALSWQELKNNFERLPEGFSTDNKMKAIEAAYSIKPLYTGIYYQDFRPVLDERMNKIMEKACKKRHGEPFSLSARQVIEDFR